MAWKLKAWKPEAVAERARHDVAEELGELEALGVELRAEVRQQRRREASPRGRARLADGPLRDLFRAT